jgi:predicted Rossmann fold nucleotide-binding protein DprA/Smf involved in DNA uptake
MARNPIIYALSRATLVVACDEGRDSTWGGATDALDRAVAPVLVWPGPGAGTSNAALVARGAAPVAAIDDLFPLPPDRVAHRPPGGGSEDQR